MMTSKKTAYQDQYVKIELEDSEIPWLKIFTLDEEKEFSECDQATKQRVWELLDIIEQEMIHYFKPDKINIASFANYLPKVHWHIMCRYKTDSYFPECMWGKKQREATLDYPSIELFLEKLKPTLESHFKK